MCAVCHQYPCHPRCPNAPEPKAVHVCSRCGEDIIKGDLFFRSGRKYYCEDCLEDMSVAELFSVIGEELLIAE